MGYRQHDLIVPRPSPATVAAIVEGYGWPAALERWPGLTRRQLKAISKRQPAESDTHGQGGQPARRLEA